MTAALPDPALESIKNRALTAMVIGFLLGGVLPGILALVAYVKADTEPETAKTLTTWSWISFAIMWGIAIGVIILSIIASIIMFLVFGVVMFSVAGTS